MSMAAAILALAVLGADGPSAAPGVSYELRVVEMRGLDWRGEVHERLSPIVREGSTAVWTASNEVAELILKRAERSLAAPKVSAFAGEPTTIQTACRRSYVAELRRVADGPVGHATALAYQPEIDQAEDGIAVAINGRVLDQGVLARVDVDESRVVAVASYRLGESVVDSDSGPGASVGATVQVPEIARTSLGGEWLIPDDGVLIVALGVHTAPDEEGKAIPCERLALIQARPIAIATPAALDPDLPPLPIAPSNLPAPARDGQPVACFVAPPRVAPATPGANVVASYSAPAPAYLPTPPPPQRMLPTPVNHLGEVVPLPPLPEPVVEVEPSAEPRPAPQALIPSHLIPVPESSIPPRVEPAPAAPAPATDPGDKAPRAPEAVADAECPETTGEPPRVTSALFRLRLAGGRLSVHGEVTRSAAAKAGATPSEAPKDEHVACVAGKCCGGPDCEHQPPDVSKPESKNDPVQTCPPPVGDKAKAPALPTLDTVRARSWINTSPGPEAASPDMSDRSEIWELGLHEAVLIALANSESVRVDSIAEHGANTSLKLVPVSEDRPLEACESSVSDLIRTVHQQYLQLGQAQVAHWAAETACDLGQQILKRERAMESVGRSHPGNIAEIEEQLARFRLDLAEATASLIRSEQSLREVMGLPSVDNRRIVAATAPDESPYSQTWDEALAAMASHNPSVREHRQALIDATSAFVDSCTPPLRGMGTGDAGLLATFDELKHQWEMVRQVRHVANHELARAFLEVESAYKALQTAGELEQSALNRLEAQKAFYEEGAISIDRYLDAVNRWASAVSIQAGMRARYNVAQCAVEGAKGTLLAREHIEIIGPGEAELSQASGAPRDPGVGRASHSVKKPTGSMMFGLSPVPVFPTARCTPFQVRIPIGPHGVFEIRAIEGQLTRPIGLFW
jgi:hypothetical protein